MCHCMVIRAWWPWIFLLIFVFPICWTISLLQLVDVHKDHPLGPFGEEWCNGFWFKESMISADDDTLFDFCDRQNFALASLFGNYWFVLYLLWATLVVICVALSRQMATLIITLENTTYFFNSVSVFFWTFLPIYMCTTGSIPFKYDATTLTFGGLWLEVWTWSLLVVIKSWAPPGEFETLRFSLSSSAVFSLACKCTCYIPNLNCEDPGTALVPGAKAPPEDALLRAQQMYFIAAPLHIYALFTGIKSGAGIRCCGRDKSFWSSFQNRSSLIAVKMWAIVLTVSLSASVLAAVVNVFIMGFKVELLIGFASSVLILTITYEVVFAMFFHHQMTRYKKRTHEKTCWKIISTHIFDKHMLITPKHFYVAFWLVLFVTALTQSDDGAFQNLWWPADAPALKRLVQVE